MSVETASTASFANLTFVLPEQRPALEMYVMRNGPSCYPDTLAFTEEECRRRVRRYADLNTYKPFKVFVEMKPVDPPSTVAQKEG